MHRVWKFLTTPLGEIFKRRRQPPEVAVVAPGPRPTLKPATALIDFKNADGSVITSKVLDVRPARKVPLRKVDAELRVEPNGAVHQKFEVPVAALPGLGIRLTEPSAVSALVRWSCETGSRFGGPRDASVRALRRMGRP
jgi:hypothetical protein